VQPSGKQKNPAGAIKIIFGACLFFLPPLALARRAPPHAAALAPLKSPQLRCRSVAGWGAGFSCGVGVGGGGFGRAVALCCFVRL